MALTSKKPEPLNRTPLLKDKRFLLTGATIGGVFALCATHRQPNEQVLTFLAITLGAFMGQSQWGQTTRTKALVKVAELAPVPGLPEKSP